MPPSRSTLNPVLPKKQLFRQRLPLAYLHSLRHSESYTSSNDWEILMSHTFRKVHGRKPDLVTLLATYGPTGRNSFPKNLAFNIESTGQPARPDLYPFTCATKSVCFLKSMTSGIDSTLFLAISGQSITKVLG